MLSLVLIACTTNCPPGFSNSDGTCLADKDPNVDPDTPPEDIPPDQSTPGWVIGDQEPCEQPLSAPHYTDHSESFGDISASMPHVTMGSISLVERNDTFLIASTDKEGVRWWMVDGSEQGLYSTTKLASRIALQDIDGDGVDDLLRYSTFIEIGGSFGTDDENWEQLWSSEGNCGFLEIGLGDLDGNGLDDLILPNGMECLEEMNVGPVIIYNEGQRTFSSWTEVQGSPVDWGATFDVTPLDLDGDQDLDLYFCNDFGPELAPNKVLYNDGQGTLSVGDSMGRGVTSYCMTSSFGDLNGDGDLDLYVGGTDQHFALVNEPGGHVDFSNSWGFPDFQELEMPWGSAIKDFDNDGLVDLAITTSEFSHLQDFLRFPIWMLHQDQLGQWSRVGVDWGLPQETCSRGLIAHDINLDGVLDLIAADFERNPWVLLSDGCTENNWLEVKAPSGTIVTVFSGELQFVSVAAHHQGFGSTQPSVAHIGLGSIEVVDNIRLDVPWVGTAWLVEPTSVRRRISWSPE